MYTIIYVNKHVFFWLIRWFACVSLKLLSFLSSCFFINIIIIIIIIINFKDKHKCSNEKPFLQFPALLVFIIIIAIIGRFCVCYYLFLNISCKKLKLSNI